MKLFKALVSSRRKTVYILALTSFIVLASIHVNVSTKGADREIINGITKGAGAHARVNLEDAFNLEEYEDELVSLLDSYAGQGVSYERQKYVPLGVSYLGDYLMIQNSDYYIDSLFNTSSHNTSALIHNNSPDGSVYTAIKGKPVDELANHEVAIPYNLLKAHGLTMENALGKQISSEIFADLRLIVFKNTLAGCNPGDEYYEYDGSIKLDCFDELSFQSESNLPLTVASVVTDISMSKMVSGDDFKPGFEFFETDVPETGYVIVSEATYQEIMFDRYLIDFELEKFVREAGYFEAGPSEISSAKNFEEISSFVGGEFPLETYNYNIRYDHYTRVVEDQLAKDVGRIKECVYSCQSIFRLETLSGRLDKEPMVSGVLKVVSSFVLMGVLISSFYSFYIHFSNQLKTSTKEISALLMSGVSWHRIVFVYFIELCIVTLLAVLGFSVLSIIMSKVNTNTILFTQSFSAYFETFKFSLVFFTMIFGLIVAKLYPFRKNVLMKFKSGSKTRIRWTGLSHQSIVRQLSLKRMFTYITSTLGYAFSISLVVLMIVLAFSTGNHIKNVYSKDTFGIHFDYMVFPVANGESEEDGWETFYASESFSEDQALVFKKSGVLFMDHSLWEGNSNFYKSSEIVFVNEIAPFVDLQSGVYPKHYTEIKGDPPIYDQEALVSRRHIDRRDAKQSVKNKVSSRVEDSYLFYFDRMNSYYENAYTIYGTINALYNNGWVVYGYQPTNVSLDGIINHPLTDQFVLNLKDDVNPKEFEAWLDDRGVQYLTFDPLVESFQVNNDAMNATSIYISLAVLILMLVLLLINLSGLVFSVKLDNREDDLLYARMGMSSGLMKSMDRLVLILRSLVSIVFFVVLLVFVYPKFFDSLLGAFGLYSMPGSILVPVLSMLGGVSIVLIALYFFLGKPRKT